MLGRRGCRATGGVTIQGYDAVVLENASLRATVLAGKGTDVVEFLYKPADLDFTWGTVWGLRPRGAAQGFIANYEGGWQEIFPNGGTPSEYRGASLDQHDEAAMLPWSWRVLEEREDLVSVEFTVDLVKTPFRLAKTLTLAGDRPRLVIEESAENLSPFDQFAMWGHHLAFGAPFLRPGCRIESGARTVLVTDEPGDRRRFRPGRHAWPWVAGAGGEPCDLRKVPGPGSGRDIVYLTDFERGYYRVENPEESVGLEVEWDPARFPQCWYWQEFGDDGHPWYGRHYNIGLEPFCGYPTHGLAVAQANGSALKIGAGEALAARLSISVVDAVPGGWA